LPGCLPGVRPDVACAAWPARLACLAWPVSPGLSRLACLAWLVSPGLSRLACLAWPVSPGLSRLASVPPGLARAKATRAVLPSTASLPHQTQWRMPTQDHRAAAYPRV